MSKPIHAKPSLYAYYFYELKRIALTYGWNLVLHGSLNRDLDLIAIPWEQGAIGHEDMIQEFAEYLGGQIMDQTWQQMHCFPFGRLSYVINLNRGRDKQGNDLMYYVDISVIPINK